MTKARQENETRRRELNNYLTITQTTYAELAFYLGVTEGCIGHWMQGRREIPTLAIRVLRLIMRGKIKITDLRV